MPLHARIPVRLVVDSTRVGGDAVRDALDAALAQSVDAAIGVALGDRPKGTAVAVHEPVVEWTGSGLHGLASATRSGLDADVRAAVAAAVARAGIVDGVLARARHAGREPILERRDPDRHHPLVDRYLLPSYKDGTKRPVKVRGKVQTGGIMTINEEPAPTSWRLAKLSEIGNLPEALNAEVIDRNVALPDQGLVGGMLSSDDERATFVGICDIATGNMLHSTSFSNPMGLRANSDGTLEPVRTADLDPEDVYRFTVQPGDDLKQIYRSFYRGALITQAKQLQPVLPNQKETERDAAIANHVDEALDARFDSLSASDPVVRLVRLKGRGGGDYLIRYGAEQAKDFPADLDVDVYPLRKPQVDVAPDVPGAGRGTGRKVGQGKKTSRVGEEDKDGATPGDKGPGAGGEGADKEGVPGTGPGGGIIVAPQDQQDQQAQEGPGTAFIGTLETTTDDTDPCAPWEGEPPISALTGYTDEINGLMGEIANRLEMPTCAHAGAFLISAARMYGARAKQVGLAPVTVAGDNRPVGTGPANLGWIRFSMLPTPQVQLLRHLAGTTPLINRMHTVLLYAIGQHGKLIAGERAGQPVSWQLHFLEEFTPDLSHAVGTLFRMTCRVVFLQLLLASRRAIDGDLGDIDNVAANFEARILPLLVDVQAMTDLRDKLRHHEKLEAIAKAMQETGYGTGAVSTGTVKHLEAPPQSWMEAADAVARSLDPKAPSAPSTPLGATADSRPGAAEGDIAEYKGTYYILDARGRWHNVQQLEDLISLARGTVESVDPLVKHIIELEDVLPRMRDPNIGVKAVLTEILRTMQAHNTEITTKANADDWFAFRASNISEDVAAATVPYTSYALRGIHLQAHESIGEFFHGDRYYALGIQLVFDTEEGRRSLLAFGELVGVVLLSVIWAPLGIAVGIGLALHHYDEAVEKEHVYDALIDPDVVISRAEVEAQLFAAKLGVALSFLPVAGKVLGALRPLVTAGAIEAEEAGAAAARTAAAEAAEEAVATALKAATADVLEKFVTELATAVVINKVMEIAIEPIIAAIERERETTGPIGGLNRSLAIVLARRQARAREAAQVLSARPAGGR
jgi:hypothetical protein